MKKYEIAIMETLKSLGANKTYVGYDYVLFGLILLFQDQRKITGIVKSLYIDIADYYETTWNCVEKNIRWLVKQIWTKDNDSILNKIFNKTSADFRITNKEFFRDMYEYIQNTYEENEVISSRLVCPITRQYCKAFTDYCMMGNVDQDGGTLSN